LDEHVSIGCRFDRARGDWPVAGVGGELAEQRVLRPAADEVHHADRASGQFGGSFNGVAVCGGEAVENAPGGLSR
jgi:hypothetical protein